MMRVAWEEWRSFGRVSVSRWGPVAAVIAAAALLLTQFQPGSLFLVTEALALALGLASGTQRFQRVKSWDWLGASTAGFAYVGGKVLGLGLVGAAWAAFLAGPIVLVSLASGVPTSVVFLSVSWLVASLLAAQALAHAFTWGPGDFHALLATSAVFGVLAIGLVPGLAPLNPLWSLWTVFRQPALVPWYGPMLWLAGSGAVWVLIGTVLSLRERR